MATSETPIASPIPTVPLPTLPDLVVQMLQMDLLDIPIDVINLIEQHFNAMDDDAREFYFKNICSNPDKAVDIFINSTKQSKSHRWLVERAKLITASLAWLISRGTTRDIRY